MHSRGVSILEKDWDTYLPLLDDWLIKGISLCEVLNQLQFILHLFDWLGLMLNKEKSTLVPMKRLTFTGALLDSMVARAFFP